MYIRRYFPKNLSRKKPKSFFNIDNKPEKRLFPSKITPMKYVCSIKLSTFVGPRDLKILKHLTNLKSFMFDPFRETDTIYVIPYLRALSKKIKIIIIDLQQKFFEIKWPYILDIYRAIRPYIDLKHLYVCYQIAEENEDYVKKIISYPSKFSNLKSFSFRQEFYGQNGFRKVMMEPNTIYKEMTYLDITISEELLPNTEMLKKYFIKEKQEQDADNLSLVNNNKKKKQITNEISPFYNFRKFPNLKSLTITSDCSNTINRSLIKSFKHLKNLKNFSLKLDDVRPEGTINFFNAFFELPLLESFSFEIPFIRSNEWEIFGQFVLSQNQLISFELKLQQMCSSSIQNKYLENLMIILDQKPNLRSLRLDCKFSLLKSIFKNINIVDNLYRLQIGTYDTYDEELCQFLQKTNNSLKYLELSISCIQKIEHINRLYETIFGFKNLIKMKLRFYVENGQGNNTNSIILLIGISYYHIEYPSTMNDIYWANSLKLILVKNNKVFNNPRKQKLYVIRNGTRVLF